MVRKFFENITRINRNNLDNPVIFVLPTYLPTYLPIGLSIKEINRTCPAHVPLMALKSAGGACVGLRFV